MLRNYLKIALRNIRRNKVYSFINVVGLTVGIASSVLILLWVANELSYDRFHKNADDIYRIVGDDSLLGKMATTCGPLAEYMKDNFPSVVNATRYMPYAGSPFRYQNKLLNVTKGAFADPAFFRMFSYHFLRGSPGTALSGISDMVITESTARKFFGDKDPLGKTLLIEGHNPVIVSAEISDPPANSQLQFNYVLGAEVLKGLGLPVDEWSNAMLYTFIEVKRNTDIHKLDLEVSGIMSKQIPGFNRTLFLQPLTGIHLDTEFAYDFSGLGDSEYVKIFSAAALFLLLIACINYVNLSTARGLKRSREVGVRKVMGAGRLRIFNQFFGESLVIVAVSFVLAIGLVEILLPGFNQISGKTIKMNYLHIAFWGGVATLLIFVSLAAGGYPAMFLSSAKPVDALGSIPVRGQAGTLLRKILVVLQFSLAIILITGTTVVYRQLYFIRNKKLGFDKENILYFPAKGEFLNSYQAMKNELLNQSSISNVTAEDRLLTNATKSTTNVYWEGKDKSTNIDIQYSYVDYNYFRLLKVAFKDGRNFSRRMGTDGTAFILNQAAVDQMKLKHPIGKRFVLNNIEGTIVGIIKNTNFRSLQHKVSPNVYMVLHEYSTLSFKYNGIILVKTRPGRTKDAIAAIDRTWKRVNPDLPFEYHFLDQTIDRQYVDETRTGEIVGYFSLIAVVISCLGLYGLSEFMTETRTKEIGVRKVLGASVPAIMSSLVSDFATLVLIADLVGWAVAYFFVSEWLEEFAYHVNLGPWVFLFSGALALVIAVLTVSTHAMKTATANPIEALRYE